MEGHRTSSRKLIVRFRNRYLRPAALAAALAVTSVALVGCTTSKNPTSSSTSSPSAGRPFDDKTVEKLDEIVRSAVTEQKLPGAIVAIRSEDGDYLTAAGYADVDKKKKLTTDLNHRIGSVTKTFTVTALLRLVDAGKAGLDDPVSRYVDGLPDAWHPITLRQLAGMQSGIPEYSENVEWATATLAAPLTAHAPRDLLAVVENEPLQFAPGSKVHYSNTNTVLLGLAIEKIAGAPLAEVITTEVTEPLGLTHTFLPTSNEFPQPHAEGYTNQTADGSITTATDWNPSWAWASGAMISNLEDLEKWVPALATGELLSPALQKERLAVVPLSADDEEAGYGLGIFNVHGWIGHNGSLPGYKTVTIYLPEKKMSLIVMVNTDAEDENSNIPAALMTPITKLLTPENVYG